MYWTKVHIYSAVEYTHYVFPFRHVFHYTQDHIFTLMEMRKHDHKIYCTDYKSTLMEICNKY